MGGAIGIAVKGGIVTIPLDFEVFNNLETLTIMI